MSAYDLGQMTHQLALAVQLNDEAHLSDFFWTGNELLQQQLLAALAEPSARLFYLWGGPGCGKSHLLQACCQVMSQNYDSARYVPLNVLHQWEPAVLEGMEDHILVAVDDLDQIAGRPDWEEALFHLYNRMSDRGQVVMIFAGRLPPSTMPIQLPDLRSRLSSGLVIQLNELQDEDKLSALQAHARKRGLDLSALVGRYLINRCARSMHELHAILDQLDHASLVAQRRITIPFVKEVLGV